MNGILYAPRQRSPLWAQPEEIPGDSVSLKWTLPIAALLVIAGVYGISRFDARSPIQSAERKIMKAVRIPTPPPPAPEVKKEEPKPEAPKPQPIVKPTEIKRVVREKAPEPENQPEMAPIPMEAPAPGPGAGPSIPTAVAPSSPAKGPAAGSIQKGVVPLVKMEPEYPRKALQAGITGSFIVHFFVSPEGAVTDCAIISGSPRDVFQREIKRACKQWKFETNGVDWIAEVPIDFVIKE